MLRCPSGPATSRPFTRSTAATAAPRKGAGGTTATSCAAPSRVAVSEEAAHAAAARADRLMDRLQRCKPRVSSLAYEGGRYKACVFAHTTPRLFPEVRPRYE